MKHILILFLGILAFNFTGIIPVNANKTYPNITIEQSSSLYQIETINNDIVSEVPLMFQEHYTETDTCSQIIETKTNDVEVSKQFIKGNYDYLEFCQFRLHNDTDSICTNEQISTSNHNLKTLLKHSETDKTSTSFLSNISYIEYLIFIKPFERAWSKSYIRKA